MHENHRERVRQRYFAEGIQNMPEHNVLELLLFYCIPRKDTNEIAHRLIAAFGSLAGVLDAPKERLLDIEGVGESTAAFITMIPQICRRYISEKQKLSKITLDNIEIIKEYLTTRFIGANEEEFVMLCFDGAGKLINDAFANSGTIKNVLLDKRRILESALFCNSETIIFAHNHPNGVASPSREDITATMELVSLFSAVGITVCDHFIIGSSGEILSMASTAKYGSLFK